MQLLPLLYILKHEQDLDVRALHPASMLVPDAPDASSVGMKFALIHRNHCLPYPLTSKCCEEWGYAAFQITTGTGEDTAIHHT